MHTKIKIKSQMKTRRMIYFFGLLSAFISISQIAKAESGLLEKVKRNPNEAVALCKRFRSLNSKGISASSKEAIKGIAKRRNLSEVDAEILSIYVIGLHCPDVN